MPEIPEDLITQQQAAAENGVSVKTVARRIAGGDLIGYRQGRYVKVSAREAREAIVRPVTRGES